MFSSHPSPDALDRYRRGLLSPEELLAVDDHLAVCAICRDAASRAAAAEGSPATPETLLGPVADGHPEFEELAAYIDGTQVDLAREMTEMHLADCASCREEVADLRAFKERLPLRSPSAIVAATTWAVPSGAMPAEVATAGTVAPDGAFTQREAVARSGTVAARGRGRLWLVLALPAAAIVVWLLLPRGAVRPIAPAPIDPGTARVDPGANPDPGAKPNPGDPSSGRPSPPPAAVATLRDGGGIVTLDAAGDVTGIASSVAPPERTLLVAALSTGRLTLPKSIRDIAAEGEVLRGGTAGSGASLPFGLIEPLGTAVESDRPRFRWQRLASARAYVVTVYDDDFALVARSPELTSPEWTAGHQLTRGRTYSWQVSAIGAEATITAPTAPAPAARFAVLTQSEADGLARLRQQHANAHLVMAVAYARAGVRDAAERELRALQRDNPDAAIVRALLASLR
jgi:anti-sigma factor RsiW